MHECNPTGNLRLIQLWRNHHRKGDNSQKVYQSGEGSSRFSQFSKVEGGYSLKATTVAQIGPNIDSVKLADDIGGKRKGEVQQMVSQIQGVEKVDVDLSPFWVSRVPDDTSRVKINFVVKNVD